MRKNLVCLILICALTFSLSGCSKNSCTDFLEGFKLYLQEEFPEDNISVEFLLEDFSFTLGGVLCSSRLTFMYDGNKLTEDDAKMNKKAKAIQLTGDFAPYFGQDAIQRDLKIFGGFLDYVDSNIDTAEEGMVAVYEMMNELAENPDEMIIREIDNGKVSWSSVDSDYGTMMLTFVYD